MKSTSDDEKQVPDLPELPPTGWIDKQLVMQRYFVGERTLQRWREKKLIKYAAVGKKFYYLEEDIQRMLAERAKVSFPMALEAEKIFEESSATHSGIPNATIQPTVKKPWYKRHRYYSERLVLFIFFLVWFTMPVSLHAASLFKDNTRYGFGLALFIRFLVEVMPMGWTLRKKKKDKS